MKTVELGQELWNRSCCEMYV